MEALTIPFSAEEGESPRHPSDWQWPLMQMHFWHPLMLLFMAWQWSQSKGGLSCIRYLYKCNMFHFNSLLITHTCTDWCNFSYHWNLYLNNKCIHLFNICLYFLLYIITWWLYNYRKYLHILHNYTVTEIMPAIELCVCTHVFRKTQPWSVVSELPRARAALLWLRCAAWAGGDRPRDRVGYQCYHLWVNLAPFQNAFGFIIKHPTWWCLAGRAPWAPWLWMRDTRWLQAEGAVVLGRSSESVTALIQINKQVAAIDRISISVLMVSETLHPSAPSKAASELGAGLSPPAWNQPLPVQRDKYTLALPVPCCTGLAVKGLKRNERVRHALWAAQSLNMNDQIAFYFLN